MGGVTAIADLRHAGSSRLVFPHRHRSKQLLAVLLNNAGGITGGDKFANKFLAAEGSDLCLTTQAAERVYSARRGETGDVRTEIEIQKDAQFFWLPQETIFFQNAALNRALHVSMDESSTFVSVEMGVLGRTAMGETLHEFSLRDRVRITRSGCMVYADDIVMNVTLLDALSNNAALGGSVAYATILTVSPSAARWVTPLRNLGGKNSGFSEKQDGVLVGRIVAQDALELRKTVANAARIITGQPVPKTWMI